MNRYRTHRRLVAWLGLLAIWLATVAPVVSQTLPLPSHATMPGAWCGSTSPLQGHSPSTPHDHTLEKCAYCALLGDSPVLGASIWLPQITLQLEAELHPLPQAAPWIRHNAIAAAPRGPPAATGS
ncbi:DUF2946 domain-containing protein [Dyella sp. DHC06]|uniref:DUF2946 domain-containing protein n=1 Tax=Dyella amyloliquefaciens TaxID=1770545 RepID=UPI0013EE54F4